jgi:hypothetical protein
VGKYEYKHIYFVSDMGMLTVISHKAAELYRSDNYVVGTFFCKILPTNIYVKILYFWLIFYKIFCKNISGLPLSNLSLIFKFVYKAIF